MALLVPNIKMSYETSPDRRLPRIGVFYSQGSPGVGMCREFTLNLDLTKRCRQPCYLREYIFPFRDMRRLKVRLNNNNSQAIRTRFEGADFELTSEIVAEIHFHEFLKRYNWLFDPTLWEVPEIEWIDLDELNKRFGLEDDCEGEEESFS